MSSFFLTQNNSRKDVWHLKWTRNGFLYPVPEDAEAVTVVFDKERGVKYQTR